MRGKLQEQIVEICKISGKADQICDTFDKFLIALSQPNTNDFKQILGGNQVHFFTTNYDLVIQNYINLARNRHRELKSWTVESGTTPADSVHWDPYNYNLASTILVPLHGSIELRTAKSGNIVKSPTSEKEFYGEELAGELLIYPVRGKYIYQDPFAKMFSLFREALEMTEFVIFIGFSFNDEAIRDVLVSTIRRRRKLHAETGRQMLKTIIYSPHANATIKDKLLPQLDKVPNWDQFVKSENWTFEDDGGPIITVVNFSRLKNTVCLASKTPTDKFA